MVGIASQENGPPIEFMLMPGEGIHLSSQTADLATAKKLAETLGYECEETG
jgi:hypothetical protein